MYCEIRELIEELMDEGLEPSEALLVVATCFTFVA